MNPDYLPSISKKASGYKESEALRGSAEQKGALFLAAVASIVATSCLTQRRRHTPTNSHHAREEEQQEEDQRQRECRFPLGSKRRRERTGVVPPCVSCQRRFPPLRRRCFYPTCAAGRSAPRARLHPTSSPTDPSRSSRTKHRSLPRSARLRSRPRTPATRTSPRATTTPPRSTSQPPSRTTRPITVRALHRMPTRVLPGTRV